MNRVQPFPAKPSSPTTQALVDLEGQREAMAKLAHKLGQPDPTIDQITDYDRRRFGTPVRFEIDACMPLTELKQELSRIRAEMTNCLATLELPASANDRRAMVHSRLVGLRVQIKVDRQERKSRESRRPNQPT